MDITILLFDDVDLLDAGGPYEVFLTASRLVQRDGGKPPFSVNTASPGGRPIKAFGGLGLTPNRDIAEVLSLLESADSSEPFSKHVLVVPGTIDIDSAIADSELLSLLERYRLVCNSQPDALVASVCTGAFLLGETGLLTNRAWTTHWEDVDLLAERIGNQGARHAVRWVDDGNVITAGGLSAGIDMALHLVHRLESLELARRTARQIDYPWREDGLAGTV